MRLLAAVIAALACTATSAAPSDSPVSLTFRSEAPALDGTVFGIQSIDGQELPYGQKSSLSLAAGLREVRYTCPGATLEASGAVMSYAFEAGQQYELVCSIGAPAVIRPTGC